MTVFLKYTTRLRTKNRTWTSLDTCGDCSHLRMAHLGTVFFCSGASQCSCSKDYWDPDLTIKISENVSTVEKVNT